MQIVEYPLTIIKKLQERQFPLEYVTPYSITKTLMKESVTFDVL